MELSAATAILPAVIEPSQRAGRFVQSSDKTVAGGDQEQISYDRRSGINSSASIKFPGCFRAIRRNGDVGHRFLAKARATQQKRKDGRNQESTRQGHGCHLGIPCKKQRNNSGPWKSYSSNSTI